jgi:hypothetical protein
VALRTEPAKAATVFADVVQTTPLSLQLALITLLTPHHGSTSPRFVDTTESRFVACLNDFCNKIDPKRTSRRSVVLFLDAVKNEHQSFRPWTGMI